MLFDDVFLFPVSFAQQRLWLMDRLAPGNAAYNIPAAVRFDGPLNLAALERAINAVVDRHETLRTNFVVVDGEPKQVIAPHRHIPLRQSDVSRDAGVDVERLILVESGAPFDLANDALLRAIVFRVGDERHVVTLTVHHIVSDGWSMGILVKEISEAYAAIVSGSQPAFPELPIQYADYTEWQRDWLKNDVLERQLAYWRNQLAGPLPALELPFDRLRPAAQTYAGASVRFEIPHDVTERLRTLAQRESATLFMTLLAGFTALLFRYTGQRDVVVGSPIANRSRRELEGLIGFFVNTLVLRTAVRPDATFREMLGDVRATTLDAYSHQDLPFEQLVEALQPERNLSQSPFFQVLFALQNVPAPPARVADATVEPLVLDAATSKFDLSVSLTETPHGLRGAAEYNVDLFDRSTIERLTRHFVSVVAAAAADPSIPVARLPLLSDDDRARLAAWNNTGREYPAARCLHELIESQVRATPGLPAVEFEHETLTYAELDTRASSLAALLHARGVGPESVVGVCLERSLDLVVSLLAILKAGGAYLPLDPTYPRERLAFMIGDASVGLVLTWRSLAEDIGIDSRVTMCLDQVVPPAARPAAVPVSRAHAVYVIYTSGSTGRPKGVVNTHGGIINRLQWMQEAYDIGPGDRVLQKTPFGFDVSVCEFFWPLMTGATLVVARPEGHKDPAYLATVIQGRQITAVAFVPSMLRAFLAHPEAARCTSLRRIISSGEALPVDVQNQCLETLRAELHNLYGPTEAAVDVAAWRCRREPAARSVPIGGPIANTQIHIVDEMLEAVPPGVAGELLIGGIALARGYVNRSELTAERFIPNPFGEPGERLYRTGDRARFRADGAIEFLGRLDFQVKIRGFRVETGEIEARLLEHTEVAAAAVIAREDRPGDMRLVAYIVPRAGGVDLVRLRGDLAVHLPEYMVPSAFVTLESMPLSPNGKLDRAALPEPEWADAARAYTAPRTSTEEILCGLWRELLGIGRIGVDDNFFSLGGHSLLATQVVSRIAELFELELPLRAIFERPTVATLAAHLDDLRRESAGLVAPPIEPAPRGGPLPLSLAQQRLWFVCQIEDAGLAYNMPAAVRIEGDIDAAVLERTLREIVGRHEILRSRFVSGRGGPEQAIDPLPRLALRQIDLSSQALPAAEAEVHRLAAAEFEQPFDLARGPLVRASLLHLGTADHVLLLTSHHIVSDGWSLAILIDEIVSVYESHAHGRPLPLTPLPIQYADFARWQRDWLSGAVLERQSDYWIRQLRGAPALLALPTDRPRPAVQTFAGATEVFTLGAALSARLTLLSQQAGTTMFMTLLAGFMVLLSRYTRQDDIVVGSPIAGRNRREVERLIGFFINTLVLRGDLSGDPTFRELLGRIRHTALDAYAHQDVPFEEIVDALQPGRSLGHTPLFQVAFLGMNAASSRIEVPGLTVTPLPPALVWAKFDLTVGFGETPDGISGSFEYNTDLFDRTTIVRMVAHFVALLNAAVASPDARVSALPLLTQAERETLRVLSGVAAAGDARDGDSRTVHERVAARAGATPDAVAVSSREAQLTYGELHGRARSLAGHLAAIGVRADTRVGICLDRSVDFAVAALAVLEAGGAYVPLDPAYPAARLRFMVRDSGAAALVSHAGTLGAELAAACDVPFVHVSGDDTHSTQPAGAAVDPSQLAYVIYTSGSSGTPKGVDVSHRALCALVNWHCTAFGVTAADRATQVASVAFDASVWEMWPYLSSGAEVHVIEPDVVRSPAALVERLAERRITVAFLPTPLAEQALPLDWSRSSLRVLLTGGDRLRQHAPAGLPFTLVNNYGPTENAVVATSGTMDEGDGTGTLPCIGRPIAGTQVYLVDERLEPVPVGVAGELVIAGESLARGYHARPDLTADRFVPNPYSPAGSRLYRTGDLARWRTDGTLDFLGRADRQAKVRGFRIEPAELEAELAAHAGVAQAAAIARHDARGDASLVAYVVPRLDAKSLPTLDMERLREYLRERLPEYLVPSSLVILDTLPMTGSGKVDYRALPAPRDSARPAAAVLPRTEMERTIAAIWHEALDLDAVSVEDNFFDVGGHSLKLVAVHERLQRALGREVRIVDLFRHATIAALAAHLSSATGEDTVVAGARDRAARQRRARTRVPANQPIS